MAIMLEGGGGKAVMACLIAEELFCGFSNHRPPLYFNKLSIKQRQKDNSTKKQTIKQSRRYTDIETKKHTQTQTTNEHTQS